MLERAKPSVSVKMIAAHVALMDGLDGASTSNSRRAFHQAKNVTNASAANTSAAMTHASYRSRFPITTRGISPASCQWVPITTGQNCSIRPPTFAHPRSSAPEAASVSKLGLPGFAFLNHLLQQLGLALRHPPTKRVQVHF